MIKSGEEVHDDDGNLVATFTRDIHKGENPFLDGCVTLADGSKPAIGTRVDKHVYKFVAERFGWRQ